MGGMQKNLSLPVVSRGEKIDPNLSKILSTRVSISFWFSPCLDRELLGSSYSKESACHVGPRFSPWVRKISWKRAWQLTPVFLPGKSHGQRSLAGYIPWGHKEWDKTGQLTLVCISGGTPASMCPLCRPQISMQQAFLRTNLEARASVTTCLHLVL